MKDNIKNVPYYAFGKNSIKNLAKMLSKIYASEKYVIYFIDEYFKNHSLLKKLPIETIDEIFFINTINEPKTNDIDKLKNTLISKNKNKPKAIVSLGGGCTLDTGKAVANLLTNPGKAEDYQGWDLLKYPAIYKIGIPTISGTGAEASRTCVMTNEKTGLKLGMNSDYTIYDQLILDPNLTKTVPKEQYFFTGMDTYLHCIESLNGSHRNALSDIYSKQAIELCRDIFLSTDMKSENNREKLMIASYLGGCAIASSYVGVIHPFSAGLSVVLGTHHCVGNCITMNGMEEFYKKEYEEFMHMAQKQSVNIPKGIAINLSEQDYISLYNSTIIHEKPLTNALGENFKDILTLEKVTEIFKRM